ncbi:MAG: hypothetical protein ACC707_15865 [Thiohalomonadales bacterium]
MNKVKMLFFFSLVVMVACSDKQSQTVADSKDKQWVAGWRETSSLMFPRAGAATVEAGGFLYVIGGIDGSRFVPMVEFAKIMEDGHLGPWRRTSPLLQERGFIDAVTARGYLYVVGGGNGPNGKNLLRSVERAKILADGQLGEWHEEKNGLIMPRRCSKIIRQGNFIYALGGFAGALLDTVEKAKIGLDGHLGEWNIEKETMTIPRYVNSVKASQGYTYVIGGHDQNKGVGINNVEWTSPDENGVMKNWRVTEGLQAGRYGLSSAKFSKRLYALGGLTGLEYLTSVETSEIQANGELSPWRYTTEMIEPRATFSTLVYKGWLYVIGGTNQDRYLNTVEYARINPKGDLGFWGTPTEVAAYSQRQAALKSKKTHLPNTGEVISLKQASMYTYINVNGNLGNVWIAGPKIELNPGQVIGFSKGVTMTNFFSKELQQQFPTILFVSKIEKK